MYGYVLPFFEKGKEKQLTITCPSSHTLVIRWSRVLRERLSEVKKVVALISSIKKDFLIT